MTILDCKPNSVAFLNMQLHDICLEDIPIICNGPKVFSSDNGDYITLTRSKLIEYKVTPPSLRPYQAARDVSSINMMNARKHVELALIQEIPPVCAVRDMCWDGERFKLVAALNGLAGRRHGGDVWLYLPWNDSNQSIVHNLGYDSLSNISKVVLYQLEHLLLVAQSKRIYVTVSDGRIDNTVTALYRSNTATKMSLLDDVSLFVAQVRFRKKQVR